MRIVQYACFFLMLTALASGLENCSPCSFASNGGWTSNLLWGKWKLTRFVSPSKNQTNFPYQETLTINNSTNNGSSVVRDTTVRDSVVINVQTQVGVPADDCPNTNETVIYASGLQRKYWVGNKGQVLEATGYVDHIGSPADTVRYFYER